MNLNLEKLIDPVIAIAQEAGAKIKEVYRSEFTVEIKADNSPVTLADKHSNDLIIKLLSTLSWKHPVLSEESEMVDFATRSAWPSFWLVDPLDGTRDFVDRKDNFCVNIGLVFENDMVLGVVHVPMLDKTYFASRGQGAYVMHADGTREPIRVSSWRGQRPFKIATSRSHPSGKLPKFLNQVGEHEVVQMGSAVKMCLVAAGEVDFYPRFGPTWEWDTAAAQCIVEEAGGRLTDLDFSRLKYNCTEILKNPSFLALGDVGNAGVQQIKQALARVEKETIAEK